MAPEGCHRHLAGNVSGLGAAHPVADNAPGQAAVSNHLIGAGILVSLLTIPLSVIPHTEIIGDHLLSRLPPSLRLVPQGLPAQLSAGGVYIAAQPPPDGGGPPFFQLPLKGGHTGAGLQAALLHMVERDQIYMGNGPSSRSAKRAAWRGVSLTPSIMAYS